MKTGEVEKAERLAMNEFDKWNEVTGYFQEHTSYYYEMQAVLKDAVHIGIQMAIYGKVSYHKDGSVSTKKTKIKQLKTKQMLQSTNITPETNYIPSGERWEYKEFVSVVKESKLDFINRISYASWQPEKLEYSKASKRWFGIFKRKLIAI